MMARWMGEKATNAHYHTNRIPCHDIYGVGEWLWILIRWVGYGELIKHINMSIV